MRRFASVFKKKDTAKGELKRANSLVPPVPPVLTALSSGSEPASSASSNGSASLQTPEDDPVLPGTPTKTKWSTWLGKKSGTIKRGRPAVDELWVSEWRPSEPPPILHAPPRPQQAEIDSDEDASSEASDDEEDLPRLITPNSISQSRKYLEVATQNSLATAQAPPAPFTQPTGAPIYPRSANPPRSLPARQSMQSAMHKTLLLRRLKHSTLDDPSILPFAARPTPPLAEAPSTLPWYNDRVPAANTRITPTSPGLRRWMDRPCFEERIAVWLPLNGVITSHPVPGSSFAVAELEYSAALDAMIGFGLPPVEEEPTVPPSPAVQVQPAPTPLPQPPVEVQPLAPAPVLTLQPAARAPQHIAIPSPLRNSALKSPASKSSVSETSSPGGADTTPTPPATTISRVRFAEDDKEDVIPLGYALRLKKRREDKAKFLREEQERRAFEEERVRQEEERLKREHERRRWEEEKRAWENEKRAMEEERKQRLYAEEVAAARLRREQQRAGGGYGASNTGVLPGVLAASSSTASLRDERNKLNSAQHSRPFHDQGGPRRQASESAVPLHANSPSSSPHTSSPGSSRPPSVAGPPQSGTMGRSSSRPPSVHTSSSEDTRQPNPKSASAGKRNSMAASSSGNPMFDRSSTYAMWSASNPSVLMPPVPPVPMYGMDMPLLPPTPPFMLQQYPRPRSQTSQHSSHGRSSPSASPSRQRHPSNGSSERVNVQHHHQQQGSGSSSRRGSYSSASPNRPDVSPQSQHPRQGSDNDARRASPPPAKASQSHAQDRRRPQPALTGSMRSQSSSALAARGRPPIPAQTSREQLHPPSPWTAPPLTKSYSQQQQQLSPAAIVGGYTTRPLPQPSRRQTTIS
ncbi:hypothetical protein DFH07DRAFT_863736 [Mycena maculata]|uniref:Uncharacterized protein n=1 Tax=Mycena maculata TaxID=230809 RepID=A0AAD7H7D8_9AGAR|nr:hypothetical protein DFH07DRAFT_863736 [Mycena maculata]